MNANVEDNKAIVLGILKHWFEPDYLDGTTTDDFVIVMQANATTFPGAGTHPKDAILAQFAASKSIFPQGMTMAVKGITAEGDRVAVEVKSHAVLRSPVGGPDTEVSNFYHFVFFLSDGKITKIHEYSDTAYLAALASGAAEPK